MDSGDAPLAIENDEEIFEDDLPPDAPDGVFLFDTKHNTKHTLRHFIGLAGWKTKAAIKHFFTLSTNGDVDMEWEDELAIGLADLIDQALEEVVPAPPPPEALDLGPQPPDDQLKMAKL